MVFVQFKAHNFSLEKKNMRGRACLLSSGIGVFVCTPKICSHSDRVATAKVQKPDGLKIFFKTKSLLKQALSRPVTNGVFKEDKAEQQLLLFNFFCMLTGLIFFPP